MSNFKIAIIGHSSKNSLNDNACSYADEIIKFIEKYNIVCCSGGSNGAVEYINTKLNKDKCDVVYFSPCKDINEHNKLYNLKPDNVRSYHYNNIKDNINYGFIYRSLELIQHVDLVICFYGTWGTLAELCFAVMLGKKIIFVLEKDRVQLKDIYQMINKINEYDYHEHVDFVFSKQELINCLEKVGRDIENN